MSVGTRTVPLVVADDLQLADLRAALVAGWRDFAAYPVFGLFFASFYVAGGLLLYFLLFARGEFTWLIAAVAGFPLVAPFVAAGLYEVSRRREAGLAMRWRAILGAVRGHGDEQILSMGVIIFVAFAFWLMVAHGIYAIFLAGADTGGGLAVFASGTGLMMLIVGGAVGALMALGFYAITVISLPLLIDREVDFISAIIVSLAAVRANGFVLLVWAAIIAVSLFIAMLPAFLGLLVVLPVLGHATWHLYRRCAG